MLRPKSALFSNKQSQSDVYKKSPIQNISSQPLLPFIPIVKLKDTPFKTNRLQEQKSFIKRLRLKSAQGLDFLARKSCGDEEKLKEDIQEGRIKANTLESENKRLKTQLTFLQKQVNKYENPELSRMTFFETLPSEQKKISIIPTLKGQVKEQQQQIENLKEQIKTYQKRLRTNRVTELEYQVSKQQEEIEKLQIILQNFVGLDQTELNDGGRIQAFLKKIQSLNDENDRHKETIKKLEKQIHSLQQEIKQIKDATKQTLLEKGTILKRLYDQINDLKGQLEEEQNKYKQLENTASVAGIDNLKLKLKHLQKELTDQQENQKILLKEQIDKQNIYLLEIQQLNNKIAEQDEQLAQAQSNIEYLEKQVDHSKFRNKLQLATTRIKKNEIGTQFPTYVPDSRVITKDDLKNITQSLKYQLRRKRIPQKDLQIWLLNEMKHQEEELSFRYIYLRLQNFPFNLKSVESYAVTQYIFSPESSVLGKKQQLNETFPSGVLASRVMHIVDSYEIMTIQEEAQFNKEISKKFNKVYKDLDLAIYQIKKNEKCVFHPDFCSIQQLIQAMKTLCDTTFTQKECDYIQQISYEETGDPFILNFKIVLKNFNLLSFKDEVREKLNQFTFDIVQWKENKPKIVIETVKFEPIKKKHMVFSTMILLDYFKPKAKVIDPRTKLVRRKLNTFSYIPIIKKRQLKILQSLALSFQGIKKQIKQNFTQTDQIYDTYNFEQNLTYLKQKARNILNDIYEQAQQTIQITINTPQNVASLIENQNDDQISNQESQQIPPQAEIQNQIITKEEIQSTQTVKQYDDELNIYTKKQSAQVISQDIQEEELFLNEVLVLTKSYTQELFQKSVQKVMDFLAQNEDFNGEENMSEVNFQQNQTQKQQNNNQQENLEEKNAEEESESQFLQNLAKDHLQKYLQVALENLENNNASPILSFQNQIARQDKYFRTQQDHQTYSSVNTYVKEFINELQETPHKLKNEEEKLDLSLKPQKVRLDTELLNDPSPSQKMLSYSLSDEGI